MIAIQVFFSWRKSQRGKQLAHLAPNDLSKIEGMPSS